MKTILFLAAFCLSAALAFAGKPIAAGELPAAVTQSIENYFPGAIITAAEEEVDDGKVEFEVTIRYKDIVLEVELDSAGRILDVDMKD